MFKMLLLGSLIFSGFSGLKAQADVAVEQLLKQIDLVLFVLKRNTLRVERYNLSEFGEELNVLPKAIADKHCVCSIDLTAPNVRAHLICWDYETERVKIIAGRKRSPTTYYLLPDKLVSFNVRSDDVSKVCFDCDVEYTEAVPRRYQRTKGRAKWSSVATMKLANGEGEASLSFVLDGRVDAVCGFLVQSDVLSDKLVSVEKIARDEAFNKGLLVSDEPQSNQNFVGQLSSQSQGFLIRIKNEFFKKLWALKELFGVSLQKLYGYLT